MARSQDSSIDSTPPAGEAVAPSDETLRTWRMAILCLVLSLGAVWIAALATGDGYVDGLGNPVGGDFAMFYVAGQMAARGEWSDLYDEEMQQARLLEQMPSLPRDIYLPYRYPPLVAIVAAPLTGLPYLQAFAVFSLVSLALWIGLIYLLARSSIRSWDASTATALLAIAAAPVAMQTLIDGQASLVWFAIAAGCWLCLQSERYVAAGCVLALAACKPNVMLLLAVVLTVRHPRMLLGLLPTGLLMLLTTLAVAGTEPLVAYAELGRQLAWKPWLVETPYWKVQSLLSWTQPLLGSSARRISMLTGLAAAVAIGLWWRRQGPSSTAADTWALCAALLINALFNPYTPVYDLTLLCLGLIACWSHAAGQHVLARWLGRRDVQCTAAVVLVGPVLSQGLAKGAECPLQAMPILMLVGAVYWLAQSTRATAVTTSSESACAT